jgi:hypothetical protein
MPFWLVYPWGAPEYLGTEQDDYVFGAIASEDTYPSDRFHLKVTNQQILHGLE